MKDGCSVFVGNIDFDIEESAVIKELSAAGRVVNFSLKIDKASGRSKGYGFCEYETPAIAEAAMKNLRISFNGRPVKINYAENDLPAKIKEPEAKPLQIDSIVSILDSMNGSNIKQIMNYLKQMAVEQPSELNSLLEQNPKLICAVLYVLLKANIIDKSKVLEMLNSSFNIDVHIDQITDRISNMGEPDLQEYSDDVKQRLAKLRYILTKGEFKTTK